MQALIRIAFILGAMLTVNAHAATLKVDVNGMVCAFCAQGIEKKVRALPQTKEVYVNLKQRLVAIEIKEGQVLAEATVRELIKEAGYDVTGMQLLPQSLEQVRAQEQEGRK